MSFSSQEKPFLISGSLFLASFALNAYMTMFSLPVSQYELIAWVAWILGTGGAITFCSAIINHKGHR